MLRLKSFLTIFSFFVVTSFLAASDEPIIVEQPKSINQCLGGLDVLKIQVRNNITVTYQWQKSADQVNWENIDNAIAAEYKPEADKIGTTWYRAIVKVQGQNTSDSSNAASVKIAAPATVRVYVPSNNNSNINICIDDKLTLKADVAGGAGDCVLQWQQLEIGKKWEDIQGQNKPEMIVKKVVSNRRYRAIFKCSGSGCCD
jgi:hypothetical protein